MNQRESSGLPLRAMVMVLLFLGVVFLLVGFQAMGGDGDNDADSSIGHHDRHQRARHDDDVRGAGTGPTCGFSTSPKPQGAAETTANRLREAGWNVTETGNLALPDVTVTTVYFGDAPGEQEAAEEVGRLLEAPVAPRVPELAEQPPGVIVVVTG